VGEAAVKIALLGAESTGKTQLAGELAATLRRQGRSAAVVPELLRAWCEREGRGPRPEEQLPIAQEQERLVDIAAGRHDVVIADTTALMVAIYSGMLFRDCELYQFAVERQRRYDKTFLAALDLPWVADGLQREGPHVREPVDALIRRELAQAGVPYAVLYGQEKERLHNALLALGGPAAATPGATAAQPSTASQKRWAWLCDKCSDPRCEHQLFTSRVRGGSSV
jgi:nicotinamide riboside kinase